MSADQTYCEICMEVFKEQGDLTPRILPCNHILCERCLIILVSANAILRCPECGVQHPAPNRERTFPRYWLLMQRKTEREEDKQTGQVRKDRKPIRSLGNFGNRYIL